MKQRNGLRRVIKRVVLRRLQQIAPEKQFRSFGTFEEAARACSGSGYEDQDLTEVVYLKTKELLNHLAVGPPIQIDAQSLKTLFAVTIASNGEREIRVLDFGGACGAHYFSTKAYYGNRLNIVWVVCETPTMCSKASRLESDELRFVTNIAEAKAMLGSIDLIHCAGAIQYVPNPEGTLRELLDCEAEWMLLSRTGVSLGDKPVITIQESTFSSNGPGPLPPEVEDEMVEYPISFIPKARLESTISEKYRLLMKIDDGSGAIALRGQSIAGLTYFAERIPR